MKIFWLKLKKTANHLNNADSVVVIAGSEEIAKKFVAEKYNREVIDVKMQFNGYYAVSEYIYIAD